MDQLVVTARRPAVHYSLKFGGRNSSRKLPAAIRRVASVLEAGGCDARKMTTQEAIKASFTQDELRLFYKKLTEMSPEQRAPILQKFKVGFECDSNDECRKNFLPFVKRLWRQGVGNDFIEGWHHRKIAEAFERVITGELKRLIITLPPRSTKSELSSFMLPAWFIGKFPNKKIIQASHTADFAIEFGGKVRNLVMSVDYRKIFPGVVLSQDSKAKGRWNTNRAGTYFAIGVGGAVAGRGADLFILDDILSEQDAILGRWNADIYDKVFEWLTSGPRQRLQPQAGMVITATRWAKNDPIGRLIAMAKDNPKADQWEVINFPAILGTGEPLWPEFWKMEELMATKATIPSWQWSAQYMQEPTSEEAAIVKREWWQKWDVKDPRNPGRLKMPKIEYLIVSLDTAFKQTERSDFSAISVWGVFRRPKKTPIEKADEPRKRADLDAGTENHIILMKTLNQKMEFPELKAKAKKIYLELKPDTFIVEAKGSGMSLIQELRAMGIPVSDFTPSRGNDKVVRMNAVSDLFSSGMVWAPCPDGIWPDWVEEMIEQVAVFPAPGEHDDLADSMTCALLRFRKGGFITLASDAVEQKVLPRRAAYY